MLKKTTNRFFAPLLMSTVSALTMSNAGAVELQVINGYRSSEAVLTGNFKEAVELANSFRRTGNSYDRAVNANSLCVAYAKMAELDAAVDACKRAVVLAKRADSATNVDRVARNNRKIVLSYVPKSTAGN